MRWIFFCKMSSIEITLPHSKSFLIRKLISHYVLYREILPIAETESDDVMIVHRALQQIEAGRNSNELHVIDVKDCGAAFRFLCAITAALPGHWLITGTPRLLNRPIAPLINALNKVGFSLQSTKNGIQIEGKNRQVENLQIDCRESSQFGSALLLAAPLMGNPQISIYPESISSAGYLNMTQKVIEQTTQDQGIVSTERDWSAALFWYAYLLLHPQHTITLKNLTNNSLQPDIIISEWFSQWGIKTRFYQGNAQISCPQRIEIPPQQLDLTNNIDAAPILSVLATLYPFELTLKGLENLNKKESKRKEILTITLSQFTHIKDITEDSFTICKREKTLPNQISLSSYNDHRFVLAWTLLSSFTQVQIDDKECIAKSYPNFFEDYAKVEKSF